MKQSKSQSKILALLKISALSWFIYGRNTNRVPLHLQTVNAPSEKLQLFHILAPPVGNKNNKFKQNKAKAKDVSLIESPDLNWRNIEHLSLKRVAKYSS